MRVVPPVDVLRQIGRDAGLDAVGVTTAAPFEAARQVLVARKAQGLAGGMQFTYRNPARSTDPNRILEGARSVVVGARSYQRQAPPDTIEPGGRVARYAWVDHYAPLRRALGSMAAELELQGWQARVVADDNALVDRAAAARAGIGWYGKNCNILLPGAGSWFVLGSVVTDAPLAPDAPLADGCGSCQRCLPACPTGALTAPGVLDARRCLAWLVQAPGVFPFEHRVALGDRLYGCDDCQEACPPNRRSARRAVPGPEAGSQVLVDVLELLTLDDEEILARHGRWYIPRRDPVYLRRNALIILGNIGTPGHRLVAAALSRALVDPEALLRAHAVWACARLGDLALLGPVTQDDHPWVRHELDRLAEVPRRDAAGPEMTV